MMIFFRALELIIKKLIFQCLGVLQTKFFCALESSRRFRVLELMQYF